MTDNIFAETTAQFTNFAAPAKKIGALIVDSAEKFSQLQLESARAYSDIALAQVRGALSIDDATSLQAYLADQAKVAKTLGDKFAADSAALSELGKQFATQAQNIAGETVASRVRKAS